MPLHNIRYDTSKLQVNKESHAKSLNDKNDDCSSLWIEVDVLKTIKHENSKVEEIESHSFANFVDCSSYGRNKYYEYT